MTNLAQSITTSVTKNPQVLLHDNAHLPHMRPTSPTTDTDPLPLLLSLRGGIPQTVSVTLHLEGTTPKVTFSQNGGPEFGGITWATNGYALMITFVFSANIAQLVPITPSLWFSDTFPVGDATCQTCCVMSVLGQYHFNVDAGPTLGFLPVDPKIVVTPIITP